MQELREVTVREKYLIEITFLLSLMLPPQLV